MTHDAFELLEVRFVEHLGVFFSPNSKDRAVEQYPV